MALDFDAAAPAPVPAQARTLALFSTQRLGAAERVLFTERLALLLQTGVPLHGALRSLLEQTTHPRLQQVIGAIADDIVAGKRFSEALGAHPQLFPSTYVNLVGASETGGFLGQVLDQLVEMDEKQEKLRSTIVSALSYPAFLIVFSVGVVLFILMSVFPKFAVLFVSIQRDLPATTKLLMAVSQVLVAQPALVFGAMALACAAAWLGATRPQGRAALDRLKLRLPLVRDIFIKIYLTRLMRVMGISLERGVTVLATLEACREVVPNAEFQRFILRLETEVTEGKGIASAFNTNPLIPVSVRQMISTGEQSGSLGKVMGRIADFYDRELTKQLTQLSKLAEPVMLLVMGVMVGTIVASLILPIFKLSSAAH